MGDARREPRRRAARHAHVEASAPYSTVTLLDHIANMVMRRGTPFRVFGVQVSGNMLKALLTLGSTLVK